MRLTDINENPWDFKLYEVPPNFHDMNWKDRWEWLLDKTELLMYNQRVRRIGTDRRTLDDIFFFRLLREFDWIEESEAKWWAMRLVNIYVDPCQRPYFFDDIPDNFRNLSVEERWDWLINRTRDEQKCYRLQWIGVDDYYARYN